MSTFKALNIEYDEESDVEIDDTKEVQIEDALKLYQTALKYHAEGPASYEQASAAYKDLFASDIFKYPESQNELRRIELFGPIEDVDDWQQYDDSLSRGFDTGPSTLPQILHLSHKNYAQFRLEVLSHQLETLHATLTHVLSDASQALEHFVSALDKDDSDTDLWKKTGQVGELLDSKRITRFCLEAVLDGDEDGVGAVLNLPGIEDGIAAQQLQSLVTSIDDHLSAIQQPRRAHRRKLLSRLLKQKLNAFDALTDKVRVLRLSDQSATLSLQKHVFKCPGTWVELGDAILRHNLEDPGVRVRPDPGVYFDIAQSDESLMLGHPSESVQPIVTENVAVESAESSRKNSDTNDHDVRPISQHSSEMQVEERQLSIASEQNAAVSSRRFSLPSRKRSGDVAGVNDGDEGRVKSKRLRARESIVEPGEAKQSLVDVNKQWEYDQHLNEIQSADDWLYETVGPVFAKLGVATFESIRMVKSELQSGSTAANHEHKFAEEALFHFLDTYKDSAAQALLAPSEAFDVRSDKQSSDFESSNTAQKQIRNTVQLTRMGLLDFLHHVNETRPTIDNLAAEFIEVMTYPSSLKHLNKDQSSYLADSWPEQFKTNIVRVLVTFDDTIYNRASTALLAHQARRPDETLEPDKEDVIQFNSLRAHMQAVLELHLDVYCLIKKPNSGVNAATIAIQGDRLERWFELTREANHAWAADTQYVKDNQLEARFLWTTTFMINALDDASQDRILLYMQDLRDYLETEDVSIDLPNNAVMTEVSIAALDREMSKLTTREFFEKLSDMEQSDPVSLIESIEPLLEALKPRTSSGDDSPNSELVAFLASRSPTEILRLWNRLLEAYAQIDYKPMVVRTQFRMIRLLLEQLRDEELGSMPAQDREATCLRALRTIGDITTKILASINSEPDALSCLDEHDLKLALTSLSYILRLLQAFNVFEDPIRIGKNQAPTTASGANCPSYRSFCKHLHELQLRVWLILYHLLKESMSQNEDLFTTPLEDRFDFLRTLHRNLGIRQICGGLNHAFIKLLKDEFFTMTHVDGYDSEQAQVLYDLHAINCFLNPSYELMDHHCAQQPFIDRTTAQHAVDLLLIQANKLPIKELVKHTLKDAIERIHGAVVRKRPTEAIQRNRDVIRDFLRSPINPLDIFQSLKGEGNVLPIVAVPEADAVLSAKGWYFLMGHISLTKFRSAKRTGPTPTEDVDIAIAFFMQELEYSVSSWETWFRLAQAYDTKIEESVVWSAEKLNNSMSEITMLQRAAIHCYVMACALAYRSADIAFETSDKITEMCSEYAVRLYSSTRPPFSMLAFDTNSEKFLSKQSGMTIGHSFQPLKIYTAWKLTKVMLQRGIAGNSKSWMPHFMLAKVLWKMHNASPDVRGEAEVPSMQDVLDEIYRAIELLPGKKDRDSKREPVLEPHYKLVSIVHKMFSSGEMTVDQAQEALNHTPYIRTLEFPDNREQWLGYILAILKNLRSADKSGWHHRMIARAADILYNDNREPSEQVRAAAVKHELTQQMFTKTMVLQVWRPEAERPGRHFVYTARYTRLFVKVLEQLKDTSNLELLARRVRRRTHEIFEHSLVWQDIIMAYLRILRARSQVQEGLETSTFSNIGHEDFAVRRVPLEKWMQNQDNDTNIVLDVLREVTELKKINQALMKTGPMDDLIGDTYAYLYLTVGRQLWDEHIRAEAQQPKRTTTPPASVEPPKRMDIMSMLLSVDGADDVKPKAEPTPEPESAPAKRRLGIGRREIRTAAEACFNKNTGPAHGSRASMTHEKARVSVAAEPEQTAVVDTSMVISAPGSVADDADDESDLSELEDDNDSNIVLGSSGKPAVVSGLSTIGKQEEFGAQDSAVSSQALEKDVDVEAARDADV